ncbi:MAG: hypothetical protein AB7C97_09670 [Oscillospiraceae bacterium]
MSKACAVAAGNTNDGGCIADITVPAVKDEIAGILGGIYPKERSGDFARSLMALGTTLCLPKGSSKCGICPMAKRTK